MRIRSVVISGVSMAASLALCAAATPASAHFAPSMNEAKKVAPKEVQQDIQKEVQNEQQKDLQNETSQEATNSVNQSNENQAPDSPAGVTQTNVAKKTAENQNATIQKAQDQIKEFEKFQQESPTDPTQTEQQIQKQKDNQQQAQLENQTQQQAQNDNTQQNQNDSPTRGKVNQLNVAADTATNKNVTVQSAQESINEQELFSQQQ